MPTLTWELVREELVDTERRREGVAAVISIAGRRSRAQRVRLWPYCWPSWSGNAELNRPWVQIS